MRKYLFALFGLFLARIAIFIGLTILAASAQTNPMFIDGNPLCANYPNNNCPAPANPLSLNQAFQLKQDFSGVVFSGTPQAGWALLATGTNSAAWAAVLPITGNSYVASPTALQTAALGNLTQVTALWANGIGSMLGQSTCSILFTKGSSTPTGIYGEVLNMPSGIYWEPVYSTSPVKTCEFGATGDAVPDAEATFTGVGSGTNLTTSNVSGVIRLGSVLIPGSGIPGNTVIMSSSGGGVYVTNNATTVNGPVTALPSTASTGTDNTAIIQAALNYAMQNNLSTVCISDGSYITQDTLQIGWGEMFRTLGLVACSGGRAPVPGLEGVNIYPQKSDRCAINVQGGRNTVISGIALTGLNYQYGMYAGLPAPYPSTAAGWLNPYLAQSGANPGGLQRNSPYCGIGIDVYSGTTPPAPYPNRVFPSFVHCSGGTSASCTTYATNGSQNGGDFSSDFDIERVAISGFAVGIAQQPNANNSGDGNGDFLKVQYGTFNENTFAISIGGTQSRNVDVNHNTYTGSFAFLTNNINGSLEGVLGGPIQDLSGYANYSMFQIAGQSLGFPVEVRTSYAENTVMIGTFGTSAGFSSSVHLDGVQFTAAPTNTGIVPACLINAVGELSFRLDNFNTQGGNRIDNVFCGSADVIVDGGSCEGANAVPALNNAAIQQAVNFSGTCLMGPTIYPQFGVPGSLRWETPMQATYMTTPTNLTNSQSMGTDAFWSSTIGTSNRSFVTQATTGFTDQSNTQWKFITSPSNYNGVNISGGVISACDTMAFTNTYQTLNNQYAAVVGDIIRDNTSGTIFVVTNVVGTAVTTRQMNNMQVNGSGACTANLVGSLGTGTMMHTWVQSIPSIVFFGDFAAGSTTVMNIAADYGGGGSLGLSIAANDMFVVLGAGPSTSLWPINSKTYVVSINNSAQTILLSQAATLTGRFPITPAPTGVGTIKTTLGPGTYSILPACASGILGLEAVINDSTTATPGATISGGSSSKVVGICNSSNNWVVRTAL